MESRIWIYGLNGTGDVIKTTWRYNSVTDDRLEKIAKFWKAEYGCTRVFAMFDSKNLNDAWLALLKTRYSKNGVYEFVRSDFDDYLESGDWELDKDKKDD